MKDRHGGQSSQFRSNVHLPATSPMSASTMKPTPVKGSIPNSSGNADRDGDRLSDQQTNDDQDDDAAFRGILPHRGAVGQREEHGDESAHMIYEDASQAESYSKHRADDERVTQHARPAYISHQQQEDQHQMSAEELEDALNYKLIQKAVQLERKFSTQDINKHGRVKSKSK